MPIQRRWKASGATPRRRLLNGWQALEARQLLAIDSLNGTSPNGDTPGFYDPGPSQWFEKRSFGQGMSDEDFFYGPQNNDWIALVGDWDGDGGDSVGFYDPASSTWYLRNTPGQGLSDIVFPYGPAGAGWKPLVGDWNGDGRDTVGFYNPTEAQWFLKNSLGQGTSDVNFSYGAKGANWTPLVGDWNGDRRDTVGLFDPAEARWFLKNSTTAGLSDLTFLYGPANASWQTLVGDWNDDGRDSFGFYDPGEARWFLKNQPTPGVSEATFCYGKPGAAWQALVGDWYTPADRTPLTEDPGLALQAPGGARQTVPATFALVARNASLASEMGWYHVEDPLGRVGTLYPGDPGYAQAVLAQGSPQALVGRNAPIGAQTTVDIPGGWYYGLYFVQNGSLADWQQHNPANLSNGAPQVFFSFRGANTDGFDHVKSTTPLSFAWEDRTGGGDRDFNDLVARLSYGTPVDLPGGVNQPPTFTAGPGQTVLEDAPAQEVVGWATNVGPGAPNEQGQQLQFLVTVDRPEWFAEQPQVTPAGTLRYRPAANANGVAQLTVRLMDDGGTANGGQDTSPPQTVSITIVPVNDAPSFLAGADQEVSSLAGLQTVANWATQISAGPANEAGQTLAFLVTVDHPELFATLPAISPTGTLTYVPLEMVEGTATVSVRLMDGGGTTNGGVDTSPLQMFQIQIEASCGFENGGQGWTTSENGGTDPGRGSVNLSDAGALLREGNSFRVGIDREFALPGDLSQLMLSFSELSFDTTATGEIRDAFEIALLDDQGQSVVATVGSGLDAIFNATEGIAQLLAPGVVLDGQMLSIFLDRSLVGDSVHVVARLVNNDADQNTSVRITCVQLVAVEQMPPLPGPLALEQIVGPLRTGGTSETNTNTPSGATSGSTSGGATDAGAGSAALNPGVAGVAGSAGVAMQNVVAQIPAAQAPAAIQQLANLPSADSQGREFWVSFPGGLHEQGTPEKSLFIAGNVATQGYVEVPGVGFRVEFQVLPGQVTTIVLPPDVEVETSAVVQDLGVHIVADDDVSVYGLHRLLFTTDAFLALPVDALGTDYLNLGYVNSNVINGSQVTLVATEDNTQVHIVPSPTSLSTNQINGGFYDAARRLLADLNGTNDYGIFTVTRAGDYQLNVGGRSREVAGSYQVRMIDVDQAAVPIQYGQRREGAFTLGLETYVFSFQGAAGQRIIYDGLDFERDNTTAQILTPSGNQIASINADDDSSVLTLTETGNYLILLRGGVPPGADYAFRLLDLADAPLVASGQEITADLSGGKGITLVQVAAETGDNWAFDTLEGIRFNVGINWLSPTDRPVAPGFFVEDGTPTLFSETGNYTLIVSGQGGSTSFKYRVLDASVAPVLSAGSIVNTSVDTGQQQLLYRIPATAGQTLTLANLGPSPTNQKLWHLFKPDGTLQQSAGFQQGFSTTVAFDGTYLLQVNTSLTTPVNYHFQLNVSQPPSVVPSGLGTEQTINVPGGTTQTYNFTARAGTALYLDSLDDQDTGMQIQIDSADGTFVLFTNEIGDSGPFYLADSGEYRLTVFGNNVPGGGSYRFRLLDIAAASIPLTLGDEIDETLASGRAATVYRFEAQAGAPYLYDSLEVDSDEVYKVLWAPNAEFLVVNNADFDWGIRAKVSGTHYLILAPYVASDANFRFRLHDTSAAPLLMPGQTVSGTFPTGREQVIYRVEGLAGQRLAYDTLDTDADTVSVGMFSPTDTQVFGGNAATDVLPTTLPLDGSYFLYVNSNSAAGSDYALRLLDFADAEPLVLGATTAGTLDSGPAMKLYTFPGQSGQRVLYDWLDANTTTARVRLYGPRGNQLWDSQAIEDRAPYTLPDNGDYVVAIVGNDAAPANYRFRLFDASAAPAITLGDVFSGDLPAFGQTVYRLPTVEGFRSIFDALAPDGENVRVTFYGPDDNSITSWDTNSDFSVPQTQQRGDYLAVVENNLAVLADYQFRWMDPSTAPLATTGSELAGSLPTGQDSVFYRIPLEAGGGLLLDGLEADGDNVRVRLISPSRDSVFDQNTDDNAGRFVPQETGIYTLWIAGQVNGPSDYRLRLIELADSPPLVLGADTALSAPLGRETFSFATDLTAGQRLWIDSLAVTSAVSVRLIDPEGRDLQTGSFSGDQGPVTVEATGRHYLILSTNSATPVDLRFRLLDAADAPEIAAGPAIDAVLNPGRGRQLYQFAATAGQRLTFDALTAGLNAAGTWIVYDGFNRLVGGNTGLSTDFSFLVPADGDYWLVVNGQAATDDVAYSFALSAVDPAPVATAGLNLERSGTIAPGGQDAYNFTGTAGLPVMFDSLDVTNDGLLVSLRSPTNQLIFNLGEITDSTPFVLPESGQYTITVQGTTPASTGTYRWRMLDFSAAPLLNLGATASGTLDTGREVQVYRMLGSPGDRWQFDSLDGDGEPINGELLAPSLGSFGQFNSNFDPTSATLTDTGTHYLLLRGAGTTPLDYAFRVLDLDALPTLPLGQVQAGDLPTGRDLMAWQFEGVAGQRIVYDGLDGDNDPVSFLLRGPAGNTIVSDNADGNRFSILLPDTGTYRLEISGGVNTPTDYEFRVLDPSTFPVISLNTPTAVDLPDGRALGGYRFTGQAGQWWQFLSDWLYTDRSQDSWTVLGTGGVALTGTNLFNAINVMLPNDGEYWLIVSGNTNFESLGFGFTPRLLNDPARADTPLNATQTVALAVGQQQLLNFSGQPGQRWLLDSLSSSFRIPEQTVVLNRGETYQLRDTGAAPTDLSGTAITADKPIAVFGGHRGPNIPPGFVAVDIIIEQLPPEETWGRQFVTMPLATRTKGDTFRYLASVDDTMVRVNGQLVATLDRGQFFEQILTGPSVIDSDKPILVAQYSNGSQFDGVTSDPFMMLIPPYEQFLSSYTVSTPATGFERNFINLIVPAQAVGLVELDGLAVPADQYLAIGTSGFFGIQLPVELGSHDLFGPLPFGAFMYGFSNFDSYGYPGGLSLAPVASASQLDLTPPEVDALPGTTATLQARVLSSNNEPLAGVRVDFVVAGVHPQNGFAFTDEDGIARFSYQGSLLGDDTVSATVGNLSDLSTVRWTTAVGAPTLELFSPEDGLLVTAGTALVASGLATADAPRTAIVLVTVNGQPVDAFDAAGSFFVKLAIGTGENVFDFVAYDSAGQTATARLTIEGREAPTGNVDFARFADVSASFVPEYARTSLNDRRDILHAQVAVRNDGQYPASAPLLVAIANLSDPTVRVLEADGTTPDGLPYYDFTGLVTGGTLAPRSRTGQLDASFFNPSGGRFTYDLIFLGVLNEAPQFTSVPRLEALVERPYRYQAVAADTDGEPLTFALLSGPAGMTIDAATGLLAWTPTADQVGNVDVVLQVVDGRGGTGEQRFTLSARVAPPNRPPAFTTLPVVVAGATAPYSYPAQAIDPDDDTIRYELRDAPAGMAVDPQTGEVTWLPTALQLGLHRVELAAVDPSGAASTQVFTVCVGAAPGNRAPLVLSQPPTSAVPGEGFAYAVRAIDPDGDSLTYQLSQFPGGMTISPDGVLTWAPSTADLGPHLVGIVVRDQRGGETTQAFTLEVAANQPPIINSAPITTAQVGQTYQYDVQASDTDDAALLYELVSAPSGMSIDAAQGLITWQPTASHLAEQFVEVAVSDGRGGRDGQTFLVALAGGAPVLGNPLPSFQSLPPTLARAGEPLVYRPRAYDPQGESLAFDLSFGPAGMAVDPLDGALAWVPTADQLGTQTAVLRVRDPAGGVALQSIELTVLPANSPPVFAPDTASLQVAVGVPLEWRIAAQDAEGDSLSFTLIAPPIGALLASVAGDPSATYLRWTPTAGQLGVHTIRIRVEDAQGGSAERALMVDVVAARANSAPVWSVEPRTSIALGRTYYFHAAADDPDADPLRYSVVTGPAGMAIDSVTGRLTWTPNSTQSGPNLVRLLVDDSRGGTAELAFTLEVTNTDANQTPIIGLTAATVGAVAGRPLALQLSASDPDFDPLAWTLASAPQGMSIDPWTGLLLWTPGESQLGPQTVTVEASDPYLASAQRTFTVLVSCVNLPPAILSRPPTSAVAEQAYLYAVRASDPENDPLSFQLESAPTGMTIDPVTGLIRWTPSPGDVGPSSVAVRVFDADGASDVQRFELEVAANIFNQPPLVVSRPVYRAALDADYQYQVRGRDPEGQSLAFALVSGPTGMVIDPNSGLIRWTSATGGNHGVTVAVQDPAGLRGTQSYTLIVKPNQPPQITSTPVLSVTAGRTYGYDVVATDPDGDTLAYQLVSGPQGLAIDELGRLHWSTSPADLGAHPVQVQVTDPHGESATQSFVITIAPDNEAPRVAITLSAYRVAQGSSVTAMVSATDNVGVVGLTLSIDGQPLVLDSQGSTVLTAAALGQRQLLATAVDAAGLEAQAQVTLQVYDPSDVAGPVVDITAPPPGTLVSSLTDIVGTASDPNLESYVLQYARADLVDPADPLADDPDYVTFAQGTSSVTAGLLGVFDPTLLTNDRYLVRLLATDQAGNRAAELLPLDVTGNLKLGEFHFTVTDLAVPLAGIPIEVNRTYDTMQANEEGDFGYGWRLGVQDAQIRETIPVAPNEYLDSLFVNPFQVGARVYLTGPDGRRLGFTFAPTAQFSLFGGGYLLPRFLPDPGVVETLEIDPTPLAVLYPDGGLGVHLLGFPFNPRTYRLTTRDGLTYEYDQFDGLQSITNRNGVKLTYTEDGIFSSTGASVEFLRDARDRITEVVDPAGVSIHYAYNAAGDLVSVTDRTGLTTSYGYLPARAHYLTTIVDPMGHVDEVAEFDAQGRLLALSDALGSRQSVVYDPSGRTETTRDALGNETTNFYDEQGNLIRAVDPLGNVREFTYDSLGIATSETDGNGNTTQWTHDERGNVLSLTDAAGGVYQSTFNSLNQTLSTTDPLGRQVRSIYDARGNLVALINAAGVMSTAAYDSAGRPTEVRDSEGNTTRYVYEAYLPNPTKIIRPDGAVVSMEYDALGQVTRYVDENGAAREYTYDASGRPLTQRDGNGEITTFGYEGHRLVSLTDPLGRTRRYLYDDADRRVGEVDPLLGTREIVYDTANRVIAERDQNGLFRTVTYDANGKVTSLSDPLGNTIEYRYDAAGNATSVTDPMGGVTQYEYDALGNATRTTDALGSSTQFIYDAVGNLVKIIDPLGGVSTVAYDSLNQAVTLVNPLGGVTTNTYDDLGNLTSITYADGSIRRFEYDSRGGLARRIEADGGITTYQRDGRGNTVAITNPLGQTTRYVYSNATEPVSDDLGLRTLDKGTRPNQLVEVINAQGAKTTFTRDAAGQVVAVTDALGNTAQYEYNALGRVVAATDAEGGVTSYTYDGVGNLLSLTDPVGNITRYEYDAAGNLVVQTDPLGNATTHAYDAAGNRTSVVDRLGRQREFSYDSLGRLVSETWVDQGVAVRTMSFEYDAVDQLTFSTDPAASYRKTYNALGGITSVDNLGTPGTPRTVLSYTYDVDGRLLTASDQTGVTVSSTYNVAGGLASRSWSGPSLPPARVDLAYDLNGQLDQVTRFADLAGATRIGSTELDHDTLGRLATLTHRNALDAVLAEYDFTYDAADQLTSLSHHGQTYGYQYDRTGQLVSVDAAGATADEAFAYDANGNRVAPDIVSAPNNQIASDGEFEYQYDAEGNLVLQRSTADGTTTTFRYDFRNRMIGAQQRTAGGVVLHTVDYTYDVFDRRIAVTVDGLTTYSVFDGDNVWADFDSAGTVLARYLFGPSLDQIWARFRPGEGTTWYLTDHQLSVRDQVDGSGNLVNHIEYSAFGQVLSETNPAAGDRFKFTGREYEAVLSLYYYRARMYDPSLGRFLSEDPFGFESEDTNLKRYVLNRPNTLIDPMGLQAIASYGGVQLASIAQTAILLEPGFADQEIDIRQACFQFHAKTMAITVVGTDVAAINAANYGIAAIVLQGIADFMSRTDVKQDTEIHRIDGLPVGILYSAVGITAEQANALGQLAKTLPGNSKKLGDNILAIPEKAFNLDLIKKGPRMVWRHHIVEAGRSNAWAEASRTILAKICCNDINGAFNGILLPKNLDARVPGSSILPHSATLTAAYSQAVFQRLITAYAKGGADGVKKEIDTMYQFFLTGYKFW